MIDLLWDESLNIALHDALGPAVTVLNWLTHLGDGTVLIIAAIALYWFGAAESRRDRAFVIAVGAAAFALAAGVKGIFQLPRPALEFTPAYYPGYTFPSAHAMGAAAFYGSLAVIMESGKRWQRYLVASVLIVVVALSRVTRGVHFLGDVVVGTILGLCLVWIGLRWRQQGSFQPGLVFLLAGMIAVVTIILGSREYVPLAIGAGFGGAAGWWWALDRKTSNSGAAILITGIGLIAGIAIVRTVTAVLGNPIPGAMDPIVFVAEIVAYGILVALVMAVPALAITVEDMPTVRWLQTTLPFRRRQIEMSTAGEQT